MDTRNLFDREDIIELFKVSEEQIQEWELRGELYPVYTSGKPYYFPSEVAITAALEKNRKRGSLRAEYRTGVQKCHTKEKTACRARKRV